MTSTIDHPVAATPDHEAVHRPSAVSLRALTKRYGDRVAVGRRVDARVVAVGKLRECVHSESRCASVGDEEGPREQQFGGRDVGERLGVVFGASCV